MLEEGGWAGESWESVKEVEEGSIRGEGAWGRNSVLEQRGGTSLAVQWLRLQAPSADGPSSIPGLGARPHKLQPRTPRATSKTQHSQTNTCI